MVTVISLLHVDAYGDSYYTQTWKVQGLCLKEHPIIMFSRDPAKLGPTQAAGICSKHGQNVQKNRKQGLAKCETTTYAGNQFIWHLDTGSQWKTCGGDGSTINKTHVTQGF